MNKVLFIIVTILCLGCSFEGQGQITKKEHAISTHKAFTVKGPFFTETLDIIIMDGCEYIYGNIGSNGGYVLCHKGNCNNPIHIYNQEKP